MKSHAEKMSSGQFGRNVLVVASGTAAAQIIYLASSPVITRMYGPEAYGLMGAFMAIAAIIGPVAALTYPMAIILPKDNNEARVLVRLSLLISIGSAIFLGTALLFFFDAIIGVFNLNHLTPYVILLPVVALFSGFLQIAENWLIRTRQFKVTAKVAVLQAMLVQGSIVLIGFLYPTASVLIIISAVAIGLKAAMMIGLSNHSGLSQAPMNAGSLKELKRLARKHKDFPVYRAPEVFLDAVALGVPVLLLTAYSGPATAGFYAIGYTVLSLPAQLIGKSVGDVFYSRISEAKNNGENMTELIKEATFYLGLIGILPYLIVILFGPWLFSFVFGAEWVTAGEYARWMAIWTFFRFMNKPAETALPALSAQGFLMASTIVSLLARIGAFVIGLYVFSSVIAAIAIAAVAEAVLEIIFLLISLHISKKNDQAYL